MTTKIRNVPISAIIAAGCASAAIYLGVQLESARTDLERETLARGADRTRIQQLENELGRLEAAQPAPQPEPAVATAPPAAARPAVTQKPPDPMMTDTPLPPGFRPPRNAKVDDSPAAVAERRQQAEIRLRRQFAEMPAELGLDPQQADRLFDLLADSRVSTANATRAYYDDPAGARAIETAAREQRDAAITALLGPDKAAEFQAFEKSIPARMQVNRIGEKFAAANVPLSSTQRQSLISAVASEYGVKPEPQPPDGNYDRSAYQLSMLDWQQDYTRRVQARIEPLLTSDQVAQYRQELEAQNARTAAARARAEGRRNSNPRQ